MTALRHRSNHHRKLTTGQRPAGALAVACPVCQAPAGHSCRPLKRRADRTVDQPAAVTHKQRREAAK